jgi:hypothetical protein
MRAAYDLDDARRISRVLARGRGSCSQRFAVLEGVARAAGIPTRVRGLIVDGAFWYPRFRRLSMIVPDRVILAWPEFLADGNWVGVSELFGSLEALCETRPSGFANQGGETLFEAVACTAVDWDGVTSTPGSRSACDLSGTLRADLGRFNSRDELFARYGQTVSLPFRVVAATRILDALAPNP